MRIRLATLRYDEGKVTRSFLLSPFDTSREALIISPAIFVDGTTPTYATLRSAGRMTRALGLQKGSIEVLSWPLNLLLLFHFRSLMLVSS